MFIYCLDLSISIYSYLSIYLSLNLSKKQQLYGLLLPITKTIQVRRTRHAGHCWRSKDVLICDILQWYGRAKAGRPARTYIQQLCANTGCSLEAIDDREGWQKRVREICAGGVTWWWGWWSIYLSICYQHGSFHSHFCHNLSLCIKIKRFFLSLFISIYLSIYLLPAWIVP